MNIELKLLLYINVSIFSRNCLSEFMASSRPTIAKRLSLTTKYEGSIFILLRQKVPNPTQSTLEGYDGPPSG